MNTYYPVSKDIVESLLKTGIPKPQQPHFPLEVFSDERRARSIGEEFYGKKKCMVLEIEGGRYFKADHRTFTRWGIKPSAISVVGAHRDFGMQRQDHYAHSDVVRLYKDELYREYRLERREDGSYVSFGPKAPGYWFEDDHPLPEFVSFKAASWNQAEIKLGRCVGRRAARDVKQPTIVRLAQADESGKFDVDLIWNGSREFKVEIFDLIDGQGGGDQPDGWYCDVWGDWADEGRSGPFPTFKKALSHALRKFEDEKRRF